MSTRRANLSSIDFASRPLDTGPVGGRRTTTDIGAPVNRHILADFGTDMRLASMAERTIGARLEAVHRLAIWLDPIPLLNATADQLRAYQRRAFTALAAASVDIYVRHLAAFYRWALGRNLIDADPSMSLVRPRVRKGRPHPTQLDDLRVIFACTLGYLRIAYALAAFAGLRAAEIASVERADIDLGDPCTLLVHGKGSKERIVPVLPPLLVELRDYGLPRAGWVLRRDDGQPLTGRYLSGVSCRHLSSLGLGTTLHSLRHAFATVTVRGTGDLLLVRDLLGHASVATTEIYAAPDHAGAHARLAPVTDFAESVLSPARPGLRAVR